MRDNSKTDRPVRLLVLWESPRHSSIDDVRAWAERDIAPLRADERVGCVELALLRAPTNEHACTFDWLLELHVGSHREAAALVRQAPLRDLLIDLRSLRLRPTVLVAEEANATHSER